LWNHVKHKHPLVYKSQHKDESKVATTKNCISHPDVSEFCDKNFSSQEQHIQHQSILQMTIAINNGILMILEQKLYHLKYVSKY